MSWIALVFICLFGWNWSSVCFRPRIQEWRRTWTHGGNCYSVPRTNADQHWAIPEHPRQPGVPSQVLIEIIEFAKTSQNLVLPSPAWSLLFMQVNRSSQVSVYYAKCSDFIFGIIPNSPILRIIALAGDSTYLSLPLS